MSVYVGECECVCECVCVCVVGVIMGTVVKVLFTENPELKKVPCLFWALEQVTTQVFMLHPKCGGLFFQLLPFWVIHLHLPQSSSHSYIDVYHKQSWFIDVYYK